MLVQLSSVQLQMSYSIVLAPSREFFRGFYNGLSIGLTKGDTRSLGYSSDVLCGMFFQFVGQILSSGELAGTFMNLKKKMGTFKGTSRTQGLQKQQDRFNILSLQKA